VTTAARPALPLALVLAAASPLAAQHEHAHGPHEGALGRVMFRTSCSAAAQAGFERGLAMLHSFWFSEADNAFRAAFAADTTCGIALWGLATNYIRNPLAAPPSPAELAAGGEAARRGVSVGARTPRERGYIAAINAFYRGAGALTHQQRMAAYRDSLAALSARNPGDPEAAIFHALALVATASPTDTTYANQRRASAILNPLFVRYPDHPGLAHYIIHANDSPQLAHLGLDAARRYASIAPAAPHAQHMPSHIFIRLGLWEEAVAANQRSYDAALAEVRQSGQTGLAGENFHAMDYMAYAYLQLGNDTAARRLADEGTHAALVPIPGAGPPLAAWYGRAAMPARVALERGDWRAAVALEVLPSPNPTGTGITHFARAVGAARLGDTARARTEMEALVAVRDSLHARGDPYWPRVMEIKRQALEAWLLLAAGDMTGALREARAAADAEDVLAKHPVTPAEVVPARELLADMYAQLGRHDEAAAAYREVLRLEPNRRRALAGLAATAGTH
jgi:tetratricopeptide (TPR) repeat protein